MILRNLHTHAVLQMVELAAAERVHVLHLFVVNQVWIVFLFLGEEESRDGIAHEHQETGRYEHDDDDCCVGKIAIGCSVFVCASCQ